MKAKPTVKELTGIEMESGVSMFTGEAFVSIRCTADDGSVFRGQLSPDEIRQHALAYMTAAEAAEQDALVLSTVKDMVGDEKAAAVLVQEMRRRRRATQ